MECYNHSMKLLAVLKAHKGDSSMKKEKSDLYEVFIVFHENNTST